MESDLAIDLHHVAKIYRKRVHALRGVNMQVRRGEIFGLLGPNGAGKSTLVKIMMTVVRPTRADGLILGRPIGHKGTLARIGYLPENHRFPRYLTGRQTIEFFAAMSKVDRPTARRRTAELLETVRMSEWADHKISTYSKGMLQRIGLAQALVNDPELVLLDEPTDGVDPVGRREILDVLGRMRDEGKTVFINSHALSELESISDRIAILTKGQVASQGTLDELTFARQRYEIEVVMKDWPNDRRRILSLIAGGWLEVAAPTRTPAPWRTAPAPTAAGARAPLGYAPLPPNVPPVLAPLPPQVLDRGKLAGGQWVELRGPVLQIGTSEPAEIQETLDVLRHHFVITRVEQVRPSLEDLFMEADTDPATGQAIAPGAARHAAPLPGARP
jgi:ABC-2 type transport system ATP-binding protein